MAFTAESYERRSQVGNKYWWRTWARKEKRAWEFEDIAVNVSEHVEYDMPSSDPHQSVTHTKHGLGYRPKDKEEPSGSGHAETGGSMNPSVEPPKNPWSKFKPKTSSWGSARWRPRSEPPAKEEPWPSWEDVKPKKEASSSSSSAPYWRKKEWERTSSWRW